MGLVNEIEFLLTTYTDDYRRTDQCIEKVKDLFDQLYTLRDKLEEQGYYSISRDIGKVIDKFE